MSKEEKEILYKAIDNETYVSSNKKFKSVKIFLYYFILSLFNKYRLMCSKKIFIVNGKAEKKYEYQEGYDTVYYGMVFSNIREIIDARTHVSYIKRKRRFSLMIKAISIKDKKIPYGYAIDYLMWKEFVSNKKIEEIKNCGHYDRLTTQLAFILSSMGKKYTMRQHGLLKSNNEIPNKIPVTKVIAFDENECKKFKENIIFNENCIYEIKYESSVKFKKTPKDRVKIGIIDVPIPEMDELIRMVYDTFCEYDILVMVHPLNRKKYVDKINITFENEMKEWNLDYIFSGPSTLVYDYLRSGYDGYIIAYDSLDVLKEVSYEFDNLKIVNNLNMFSDYIVEIKKEILLSRNEEKG